MFAPLPHLSRQLPCGGCGWGAAVFHGFISDWLSNADVSWITGSGSFVGPTGGTFGSMDYQRVHVNILLGPLIPCATSVEH